LTELGFEIFPRERQTPEALGALQRADAAKWWPDGIKCPKRGKKMPAVKLLHQQSDANTKPEYIMGHSLQAVSVLVGAAHSFFAVPLATSLVGVLCYSACKIDPRIASFANVTLMVPFGGDLTSTDRLRLVAFNACSTPIPMIANRYSDRRQTVFRRSLTVGRVDGIIGGWICVNSGGWAGTAQGRPGSQQGGPARDAACPRS